MERSSASEQKEAWRAGFRRKYIRKFVAVLRTGRIERVTSVLARSRAVKLAADLSLALTARRRNTWSQAILRKYLFRLNKSHCQRRSVPKSTMNSQRSASPKNTRLCKTIFAGKKPVRQLFGVASRSGASEESEGTVASRMQTLRALVPGNGLTDPPVFLKEAADYIEALKMQVQAMQALTDWYSNHNAHTCQL